MNIGIVGRMGSGKTTIANYLVEKYGYKKESLAAPMRQFVTDVLNIDKTDPRYRLAMQELGTEWGRKYDNLCWVRHLLNRLEMFSVVVDDIRFLNEAKVLHSVGWLLLYLDCPPEVRKHRCVDRDGTFDPETESHPSELEVDEISLVMNNEVIYINSGLSLEKVLDQVDEIINEIEFKIAD
jgi:dephospho-CoA kinase